MTLALCRHCQTRTVSPSRSKKDNGLCSRCYEDLAIRRLYVPPAAARMDFYGGHALPSTATAARPGSDEKIAVLAARVEARVALWHPHDGEESP